MKTLTTGFQGEKPGCCCFVVVDAAALFLLFLFGFACWLVSFDSFAFFCFLWGFCVCFVIVVLFCLFLAGFVFGEGCVYFGWYFLFVFCVFKASVTCKIHLSDGPVEAIYVLPHCVGSYRPNLLINYTC